jgi:hypothetical protein
VSKLPRSSYTIISAWLNCYNFIINACKYLELFAKTDNKSDKMTIKMMELKNKKKIAKMC